MTIEQLTGSAPRSIDRPPVTAKVVRADETGIWAVPLGGDARSPVGPCAGPSQLAVDELVLLTWTADQVWVQPVVDTGAFETTAGAQTKANAAREQAKSYSDTQLGSHAADTTGVHGIPNTAQLETQAGAQAKADAARAAAISFILGGTPPALLDTLVEIAAALQDDDDAIAALNAAIAGKETPAGAQAKADAAVADHEVTTARFHGNTGVRRVVDAGDIADLPDLVLLVRRAGDVVSVWTREPVAAAFTGTVDLYTLPAELRPDANTTLGGVYDPTTGAPVAGASIIVRHDGLVRLIAVAGARHVAAVTGTVNAAWPAAYPGTGE